MAPARQGLNDDYAAADDSDNYGNDDDDGDYDDDKGYGQWLLPGKAAKIIVTI